MNSSWLSSGSWASFTSCMEVFPYPCVRSQQSMWHFCGSSRLSSWLLWAVHRATQPLRVGYKLLSGTKWPRSSTFGVLWSASYSFFCLSLACCSFWFVSKILGGEQRHLTWTVLGDLSWSPQPWGGLVGNLGHFWGEGRGTGGGVGEEEVTEPLGHHRLWWLCGPSPV
jgi:hypothetical protein